MDDGSDLLIAACGMFIAGSLQRKRSCWVRPSLLSRNCYSNRDRLRDLKADDLIVQNPIHFQTFMKLTNTDFEYLLNIVGPRIVKKDTNCRTAISAQDRLAITLKYLSTGESFISLCDVFKVSPQIISYIIPEVCQAIIDGLSEYVKIPRTSNEWKKVANRYLDRWNVPNCLGSMDGKHVKIQCPPRSGSEYFNYKSYFSIVLFALVDADYKFLYANVGCQGRISDGGVFNSSALCRMLNNNSLNLPDNKPLPGRNIPVPYFFLGDDAFALQTHIIKPYDGNHTKRSPKRVYNYRICRGRRVVENVFGQLTSKFQIFKRPIQLCPQKTAIVTLACVHLFNYIKKICSETNMILKMITEKSYQVNGAQ
nr:uncharacterized protein LOC128679722 [Plodia interpunctella]